jgi:Holliday junction DNA helicase RuvB
MNEMDFENRIVSTEFTEADNDIESSLRQSIFRIISGRKRLRKTLKYISKPQRAGARRLNHVHAYTALRVRQNHAAGIIANEMGVNIRITSGGQLKSRVIWRRSHKLQEGDVLFIDEIHRLIRSVEEVLYPAMEDRALDIIIGKGPSADQSGLICRISRSLALPRERPAFRAAS